MTTFAEETTAPDVAVKTAVKRLEREKEMKCRVCGCTERDACFPPCAWVPAPALPGNQQGEMEDLCTTCNAAVAALLTWASEVRRANMQSLLREYSRRRLSYVYGATK